MLLDLAGKKRKMPSTQLLNKDYFFIEYTSTVYVLPPYTLYTAEKLPMLIANDNCIKLLR